MNESRRRRARDSGATQALIRFHKWLMLKADEAVTRQGEAVILRLERAVATGAWERELKAHEDRERISKIVRMYDEADAKAADRMIRFLRSDSPVEYRDFDQCATKDMATPNVRR